MPARILLVDDHRIVRDGLRALLQSQSDLQVVAEADDGRTAIQLASELSPDVIVMDISMPDLNGIDATRQIHAARPNCKVVVLTAHFDHRMATQVMDAGAKGLVPKDAAFEELALAIRTVMSGKNYLSPRLPSDIVASISSGSNGADGAFRSLSGREREVLQLIAEGKSTKEIAFHLDLSTKTIETHRRQIMEKLAIDNVADLTKYAVREGLTSL